MRSCPTSISATLAFSHGPVLNEGTHSPTQQCSVGAPAGPGGSIGFRLLPCGPRIRIISTGFYPRKQPKLALGAEQSPFTREIQGVKVTKGMLDLAKHIL